MNNFKFILIGNYLPDKQESMIRFAKMLNLGLCNTGFDSEIWWPKVVFGRKSKSTTTGLGKWLGYIDKWIVFPIVLRWRLLDKSFKTSGVRFHICDHSNAPYLKYLPANRTGITCHDVIAIRGGIGYTDTYVTASGLGKILQKWILHHLSGAKLLACVSQLTLTQLKELVAGQQTVNKDWRVIHNAFNADFRPMKLSEAKNLLSKIGINSTTPFILHVGSGLPRKNRKLLLDMVAVLGKQWGGNICFAGEALGKDLSAQAQLLGLQNRIISIVKPDHVTLVALYSTCDAFVFPSLSEGFGWPVIEAQACGAPVIASNIEPMPEVSGGAALHANPTDPHDFAKSFLVLRDKAVRDKIMQRGFENSRRFELAHITNAYLDLHGLKKVIV